MKRTAVAVITGLCLFCLSSPFLLGERRVDKSSSDLGSRPRATAPIRTLDEFFHRLELDFGYQGDPRPEWILEPGAPPLSADSLRLALLHSQTIADSLVEASRQLETQLAVERDASARPEGLAQVRRIEALARSLAADPYLGFLVMGRTTFAQEISSTEWTADWAGQMRSRAEQAQLGIQEFGQGESHRVVDWRRLSAPTPLQLAREIVQLSGLAK